jgi:hypothetical protein
VQQGTAARRSIPKFGENGPLVPPYDIRTPTRMNHDWTVFKNFSTIRDQKLQMRVGFFKLFNQAFATPRAATST